MRTISSVLFVVLLAGCRNAPSARHDLSPGTYVLVSDVTDIPDNETTHDESECTIVRDGTNITIKGMTDVGRWWVGSARGSQVFLTVHHENPDPMIKAMELRMTLEGRITGKDYATGTVQGYAGTNNYITGTWTLRRKNMPKTSNQ